MKQLLALVLAIALGACGEDGPVAQQPVVQPADTITEIVTDRTPTNGPVELHGPDGRSRMVGDMRNGKRHGLWTSYHPNGAVQSRSSYADGVLHGTTVVFHENGQLYYTGDYRHGVQVGEWRFHDEMGTLLKTVRYDSAGAVINDR